MKNEKLALALKVWKVMNGFTTRREVLDVVNETTADLSIEAAENIIFNSILRWSERFSDISIIVSERMHELRIPAYMERYIYSLAREFVDCGMYNEPIIMDDGEPLPF